MQVFGCRGAAHRHRGVARPVRTVAMMAAGELANISLRVAR